MDAPTPAMKVRITKDDVDPMPRIARHDGEDDQQNEDQSNDASGDYVHLFCPSCRWIVFQNV